MTYSKHGLGEPTWEEWKAMPYVKFITLSTHELQTTLGRIKNTYEGIFWEPSPWGEAAMEILGSIHEIQDVMVLEEFAVMPNHIHLLAHFKRQHPQVVHGFVAFLKNILSREMQKRRPAIGPIWDKSFKAHSVQTKLAQMAYSENLSEHYLHWKYDSLNRPFKDPFSRKQEDTRTSWWSRTKLEGTNFTKVHEENLKKEWEKNKKK